MSVAFFPAAGLVTFGSESAATKIGMGASPGEAHSFRFDLDDVAGETVLLRWCEPPLSGDPSSHNEAGAKRCICCAGIRRPGFCTMPGRFAVWAECVLGAAACGCGCARA